MLNFIKSKCFIIFLAWLILNFEKKNCYEDNSILFSIAILASCNVYRYTTIESKSIRKNGQAVFTEENDTMRIEYNFSGSGGPVAITIFNKTNLPLYVDWKRSSFIVNDKAVSYFNPNVRLDGTINSQSIQSVNQITDGRAAIRADLLVQPGSSFIPPQSYAQNTYVYLTTFVDTRIPIEKMKREKLQIGQFNYRIWKADFSEADTPLFFKSYITFTMSDNSGQFFSKQHDFYIASSVKTSLNPEGLYGNKMPGNIFVTSNLSGFGSFVGVTAVLGGITLAAIAAPDNTQQ